MKGQLISVLLTTVFLCACSSDKPGGNAAPGSAVERGPNGTIAYYVDVEATEPGARIEANGDYVGTAPMKLKIWGDKDGTFHNFGSYEYVIRAFPVKPGQPAQTKMFRTGGWFTPEDKIPSRLYFDLTLAAAPVSGEPSRNPPGALQTTPAVRTGTGFFVTEDGVMLTSAHIVENARSIKIKVGESVLPVKILRKDLGIDVAVLKVEGKFSTLPTVGSQKVKLGERVYTLGFPKPDVQGQEPKFTEGNVSSLTGFQDDAGTFQTSVPVQPGNSGGPLVNAMGEVIGIIVAKLRGGENVNYAIKSGRALAVLEDVSVVLPKPVQAPTAKPPEEIAEMLKRATVIIIAE